MIEDPDLVQHMLLQASRTNLEQDSPCRTTEILAEYEVGWDRLEEVATAD